MLAADCGMPGSIEAILSAGADQAAQRTADGLTPVHIAARRGDASGVVALLQALSSPGTPPGALFAAVCAADAGGQGLTSAQHALAGGHGPLWALLHGMQSALSSAPPTTAQAVALDACAAVTTGLVALQGSQSKGVHISDTALAFAVHLVTQAIAAAPMCAADTATAAAVAGAAGVTAKSGRVNTALALLALASTVDSRVQPGTLRDSCSCVHTVGLAFAGLQTALSAAAKGAAEACLNALEGGLGGLGGGPPAQDAAVADTPAAVARAAAAKAGVAPGSDDSAVQGLAHLGVEWDPLAQRVTLSVAPRAEDRLAAEMLEGHDAVLAQVWAVLLPQAAGDAGADGAASSEGGIATGLGGASPIPFSTAEEVINNALPQLPDLHTGSSSAAVSAAVAGAAAGVAALRERLGGGRHVALGGGRRAWDAAAGALREWVQGAQPGSVPPCVLVGADVHCSPRNTASLVANIAECSPGDQGSKHSAQVPLASPLRVGAHLGSLALTILAARDAFHGLQASVAARSAQAADAAAAALAADEVGTQDETSTSTGTRSTKSKRRSKKKKASQAAQDAAAAPGPAAVPASAPAQAPAGATASTPAPVAAAVPKVAPASGPVTSPARAPAPALTGWSSIVRGKVQPAKAPVRRALAVAASAAAAVQRQAPPGFGQGEAPAVAGAPEAGSKGALLDALNAMLGAQYPRAGALELRAHHVLGVGLDELSDAQLEAAEEVMWQLLKGVQGARMDAAARRERVKATAEVTHAAQMAALLASKGQ